MLTFKYRKINAARFLSHLDVFKSITRAIRRADIDVSYSLGYNPHMLMNLSNPIPLGIESVSEYCFLNTDISAEDFMKKYLRCQQESLAILKSWDVPKNPNIAGYSHSAQYELYIQGLSDCKKEAQKYLEGEKVLIEYFDKGSMAVADCKDKILSYKFIDGDKMILTLFFGNNNLRADRLAYNICRKCDLLSQNLHIVKTDSYVAVGEKIIGTDEYLSAF